MDKIWYVCALWFFFGLCFGLTAGWLIFAGWRRSKKTDGKLTLDLTGENTPVALELRELDAALEARRVTLDFEVLLPPEKQWDIVE